MPILEPDQVGIRKAVDAVKNGYIIAYPTETFYGLGVNPYDEKALSMLYMLKGWKEKRPVSVLIDRVDRLSELVTEVTPTARKLIEEFWPGPLTLLFKAKQNISSLLTGGTGKIGIRLSSNKIAGRLLNALNAPLTTTSANLTNAKEAVRAEEVVRYFNDKVALTLEGGELKGVKGSTILDVTGDTMVVIREGDLPVTVSI